MRQPNLNSLKMFDAAARHLNFRVAAAELNLTQGAVAQQVRKLESELGLQLFQRQARGLELTEIGLSYHQSISRALAIIDHATQKLQPQEAVITLSVPPSLASKWLVSKLKAFSDQYPNIYVQTEATAGVTNFQSDNVDLAIRQGHAPFSKDLHTQLLAALDLRAVCSPNVANKIGTITQLEECLVHPLIQDSHKLWERLLEENGLKSNNRMLQFNQTTLAMDAAANGQGITLAPRLLLNKELKEGKLVELCQDTRSHQGGYYIVYPQSRKYNSARDTFIEWILANNN